MDPLLQLWAERRERATRSACGLLTDLTSVIENTRSESATALIFQTSEVLSINFNLEEDRVNTPAPSPQPLPRKRLSLQRPGMLPPQSRTCALNSVHVYPAYTWQEILPVTEI